MKNQKLLVILLLFVTSCSEKSVNQSDKINNVLVNKNTINNPVENQNEVKFENRLTDYIDSSDDSVKVVFREIFGMEKSKKEAKIYCEKLDKGSNALNEVDIIHDNYKKKLDDHIITQREFDAITSIYYSIFYIAQDTYCPKYRNLEQIPLNERMK